MKTNSIYEIYQQKVDRRDAIIYHYLNDKDLKTSDLLQYKRYRSELRTLNGQLRILRQCIADNPMLTHKPS